MIEEEEAKQTKLTPLEISCTASDCENELHCFKQNRKMKMKNRFGMCRSCGIELVDWERVYKRDRKDANHTFSALKNELIRHYFWHVEIDEKAIMHARRKGEIGMIEACERRIRSSVGKANPSFDGRQTPREGSGNAIYYAQHATASCCRKCMEYWHDIPQGRELTDEEIRYFTNLAMLYIKERVPSL